MDKSLFHSTLHSVAGPAHHTFTLVCCNVFPGNRCCRECLLIILMYLSTNSARQAINIPITGRFPFLHSRIVNISQYLCQCNRCFRIRIWKTLEIRLWRGSHWYTLNKNIHEAKIHILYTLMICKSCTESCTKMWANDDLQLCGASKSNRSIF